MSRPHPAGSPQLEAIERKLATLHATASPTITLVGDSGAMFPSAVTEGQEGHYTGPYERRVVERVGYCPAMEAPWRS